MGFIEQAGRGQPVPFVPVCADGCGQKVPEVIVAPMHPGQAVIDFELTGLEATGRQVQGGLDWVPASRASMSSRTRLVRRLGSCHRRAWRATPVS